MHVLAGLVAVIGALLVVLWRIQQASHAVRDIADAAEDGRGFFRRWAWRRKSGVNPLDMVSDPREAAVAMMAATAEFDGALTKRERNTIIRSIFETFSADARQAEELLAQARWSIKGGTDVGEIYRRLITTIRKTCTLQEQQQLIVMLQAVAEADGPASPTIAQDIKRLTQSLQ
jgi:uncharacterized tellurite resistance protein B-like protein